MGSSFDRSDSISDDDEAQDVFVLPEEDSEVENAKELNNIKRILNECRVLYKSKVDHHNRKVIIIWYRGPQDGTGRPRTGKSGTFDGPPRTRTSILDSRTGSGR